MVTETAGGEGWMEADMSQQTIEWNAPSSQFPKFNFEMKMGKDDGGFSYCFNVKKTILSRVKYWLFCKFFPFRIILWE